MTRPPDKTDRNMPPDDAQSGWVAQRLTDLMAEHGVPVRQQAALLNELCGISLTQARRKLHGATWSFMEVLAVANRFGASLDKVFADSPLLGVARVAAQQETGTPLLDATFLMDKLAVPCRMRLGARIVGTPGADELVTAQNSDGWYVGTRKQLDRLRVEGPGFRAEQVLLIPAQSKPSIRIAVLDDDIGTSETLGEWFETAGYGAAAFTSCDQLLAAGVGNYDAFVVDFMLAGGDSSQAIITRIRRALPDAPIVLLTGKLRDGRASEAELATMLRTANVTFFEKPVRPSVLAATIEKELDQIAGKRTA